MTARNPHSHRLPLNITGLLAGLLGTLLIAGTLGAGCFPATPGDIYAGIEDELANADPITTFDGQWFSPQYSYSLEIDNRQGEVLFTNSRVYDKGDVILVIVEANESSFTGRHMFTDGSIQEVIGNLVVETDAQQVVRTTINLSGGGFNWTLEKLNQEAPNQAPTAEGQSIITPVDMPVTIELSGSDADQGTDPELIFVLQSLPLHGVLSGDPPNLTYTPDAGFTGNDLFTFAVSDGQKISPAASVLIRVGAAAANP